MENALAFQDHRAIGEVSGERDENSLKKASVERRPK